MTTLSDYHDKRRLAAVKAINVGGGPAALARDLSRYLGSPITRDRVAKWRYTGIPVEWGVVIEHLVGVPREKLNPWEYTVKSQLIHRSQAREILKISA